MTAEEAQEGAEVTVWSSPFSFEGRIGRDAFWATIFLNLVATVVCLWIAAAVGARKSPIAAPILIMIGVISTWQILATQTKRWHDIGKTGWMALLYLVPIVNVGAILYAGIQEGTDGPNKYGDGPQEIKF